MILSAQNHIAHCLGNHPIVPILLSIAIVLGSAFLLISEIFRPVGKRRAAGKKWVLPPGPKGIPIFGSLLDMKSMRGDQDHTMVSETGVQFSKLQMSILI